MSATAFRWLPQVAVFALMITVWQVASSCRAADGRTDWQTDLRPGQRLAARHNTVLLVVETAADFTAPPFSTPAGEAFKQTTLQDQRVAEAFDYRVALVARSVGTPAAFRTTGAAIEQGAIFYFCDARLRVLHLLIGYPSAARLLEALESADRLRVELASWPNESQQREALQDWHQIRTLAPSRVAVEKQMAVLSRRLASEAEAASARLAIESANHVRQRELLARFGANWPGRQMPALSKALSMHGDVRTDFAHLVLAKLPLVPLDQLNCLCYETVYECPYWRATPRQAAVHRWFVARLLLDRPMLIVFEPNSQCGQLTEGNLKSLAWKPASKALRASLDFVDAVQLTCAEAATLARDTVLSLPASDSKKPPRYLLVNGNGDVSGPYQAGDEPLLAKAIKVLRRERRVVDKVASLEPRE